MNVRRTAITAALGLAGSLGVAAHAAPWTETTKISGFADAYYKFNPDGRKSATSATVDKVFDLHENTFALAGGKVELASMDGMALVDLYFGDYGALLQTGVGLPEPAVVGQAYIGQAWGPVTVTLGRFATHLGYEVIDSVSNLNYTRGLLFASVPFYHQGLKLNYSPVDGLGLMAMLDNGNSTNYTTSNETAGGAQISYTGVKGLGLTLNYYYAPAPVANAAPTWGQKTHFIDAIVSFAPMDTLTFAAEYLYFTTIANSETNPAGNTTGTSQTDPATGRLVPYSPKTNGYALYVDYKTPMEGLSITPRFEALYAPDAGGPVAFPGASDGNSRFDYTLTARFTKGALINWVEFRDDASDDAVYPGPVADGLTAASYNEMALTWGVGYKF